MFISIPGRPLNTGARKTTDPIRTEPKRTERNPFEPRYHQSREEKYKNKQNEQPRNTRLHAGAHECAYISHPGQWTIGLLSTNRLLLQYVVVVFCALRDRLLLYVYIPISPIETAAIGDPVRPYASGIVS